ncbi:MAG: SufD family Fe-S cluster assembly protein, partial [Desulfobacterales bacterium]|nr:SufD family Fe-S cluster assembly protein [Desulfobacterales bacterium]
MHDIDRTKDVNLENYQTDAENHQYVEELTAIDETDARQFLDVGVDTRKSGRSGTFIQMDKSVIHCQSCTEGVEVMGISQAREKYEWLSDYMWKSVSPEVDKFTTLAARSAHEGYFIRSRAGVVVEAPVQACLYIAKEGFA